ncbi:uncharacterized protein EV422DRAFT_557676 [Fimicolochytrium jonesii]|uniref:uncharacterized protein n=1 Tax=Fimicolochytrium jonesii TaxID=1396493 RepID=UPI0022FE2E55|nr:uncharacterized protein EV422DRAFT_557676 [Fimicolochytrium jonesii]KAI8820446.1 hypothetical protein EV422DRAFT_557676 [Fimicolochytrium jonesii]
MKSQRSALLLSALSIASGVHAHMHMSSPSPRGDPKGTVGTPDFDINSPLGPGRPFPCQGKPAGPSTLSVKPGDTIPVKLEGGASHGGGHCQFSLSFDGQNFAAVKTVIRECMRNGPETIDVTLPNNLPSGKAVFSWSWVNAIGNRELYQNCADITINGGTASSFTGPKMLVANQPGFPQIPEMTNGADDGRALYGQTGSITISPGGSSPADPPPLTTTKPSGGNPTTSTPDKPATTPVDKPTTTKEPSKEPTTPTRAPTPAPTDSTGCSNGSSFMECDGKDYLVCFPDKPSVRMPCAPGTECRAFGKFIQCDWPQGKN